MRGSQSISDLSNIHDNTFSGGHLQDRPNSSAAHGPRGNKVKQALTVDHSPLTGSKRNQACTASKNVSASSTVNNGTFTITKIILYNMQYIWVALTNNFFPLTSLVWCLVKNTERITDVGKLNLVLGSSYFQLLPYLPQKIS